MPSRSQKRPQKNLSYRNRSGTQAGDSTVQGCSQNLAPYASSNEDDGGRLHFQKPHQYRSPFQRDRDRIIHSKAFRRLGYKTQVFVNWAGDIYRTRLTHSLEVAQIARSVSRALQFNEDLTETLALGHDLGHSPFGHAGEEVLDQLVRDEGGFDHNCQGLRQVSCLESRYLGFRGLNLTRTTLQGLMKHGRSYPCDRELLPLATERRAAGPVLEAVLADQCDSIAYLHHDIEDGLDANILSLDQLQELALFADAYSYLSHTEGSAFRNARLPLKARQTLRLMLDRSISDLIETTQIRISHLRQHKRSGSSSKPIFLSRAEIYRLPPESCPVSFSQQMQKELAETRELLYQALYRHPKVMQMSQRASRIIESLFLAFSKEPHLMPEHYRLLIEEYGVYRITADYIAGMTDRFAEEQFQQISSPQSSKKTAP